MTANNLCDLPKIASLGHMRILPVLDGRRGRLVRYLKYRNAPEAHRLSDHQGTLWFSTAVQRINSNSAFRPDLMSCFTTCSA